MGGKYDVFVTYSFRIIYELNHKRMIQLLYNEGNNSERRQGKPVLDSMYEGLVRSTSSMRQLASV